MFLKITSDNSGSERVQRVRKVTADEINSASVSALDGHTVVYYMKSDVGFRRLTIGPSGTVVPTGPEEAVQFIDDESDLTVGEIRDILKAHTGKERGYIPEFSRMHPDIAEHTVENWTRGRSLSGVAKTLLKVIAGYE